MPGLLKTKTHNTMNTINLTPEETEIVYFALNDHALKYMRQSKTWGKSLEELLKTRKSVRDDYPARMAREISQLQTRFGAFMFENETE